MRIYDIKIMVLAILIGFEYTINSLTGAIIDLYHAYKWCKSFNCDIYVITDITSIKNPNNLEIAIDKKIAQSDIRTFYNSIKFKTIVANGKELILSIAKILELCIDPKIIIYYSGHGIRDSMIMPDKTLLSFINFRDNILNNIDKYVEIFWILDCCNPDGLQLPYKLDDNTFMLSSSKIQCVSQPILLITSSDQNEKSIATKLGSVFSQHLFKLLTSLNNPSGSQQLSHIPISKNRNLRRLIGNLSSSIRKMHTGYSQTVSIYSSYVIDPVLWMWIGSRKNYDIVTDSTLSVLIIRKNSTNPYDLVYPE